MQGIVSLLDDASSEQYQQLLRQLRQELGVRLPATDFRPHFSYHISETYQQEQMLSMLEQIAWQMEPFTIQVSGLGIFTGPKPIVYATIVRTRQLAKLQEPVWDLGMRFAFNPSEHYHPQQWVPHITLLDAAQFPFDLAFVVERLNKQPFAQQISVNNLTFLTADSTQSFPFGQA
jgi:2'-5' RNA ligase